MENIEDELDNKSIERDEEPTEIEEKVADIDDIAEQKSVPKKRSKKERSPAQIAAFEKARLKRQENYRKRQEAKKTVIDEEVSQSDPDPVPKKRPPIKTQSTRKQSIKSVDEYHDFIPEPPQPIINNYYYGTNQYKQQKSKKKKKVEIVESSSESSDSDEEYLPPYSEAKEKKQIQKKLKQEIYPTKQQQKPSLSFKYV